MVFYVLLELAALQSLELADLQSLQKAENPSPVPLSQDIFPNVDVIVVEENGAKMTDRWILYISHLSF
jgi:hypothetical protein